MAYQPFQWQESDGVQPAKSATIATDPLHTSKSVATVATLAAELDADFEERSAVAEFEGGFSRAHAEAFAAIQTMPVPDGISRGTMSNVIDAAGRFLDLQKGSKG